jgi:hypothetical protein
MYKKTKERFNIEELGDLKKHLGIWWTWHKDNNNEIYLKATMPKMVKEIQEKFEMATKKKPKVATTPGFPIKC